MDHFTEDQLNEYLDDTLEVPAQARHSQPTYQNAQIAGTGWLPFEPSSRSWQPCLKKNLGATWLRRYCKIFPKVDPGWGGNWCSPSSPG